MNTSTKVAAGLMAVYGLIALVGGVIGYVKADSLPSLFAGGGSGLLLIACAAGVARFPLPALIVGALASLALVGRFAPILVKSTSESQPAAVPIVMTVGGVVVLIAVVIALGKRGVFRGGS